MALNFQWHSNIHLKSNDIHYKQLTIIGSHGSTPSDHKKALKLIEKKIIHLKPLITDKYSLENIKKAYQKVQSGEGMKICIKI